MDPFLARTMVETLSKGINPVTGCVLSKNDCCANEEIQDALIEVLGHCAIESTEQFLIRMKEERAEAREEKKRTNAERYPHGVDTSAKAALRMSIGKHFLSCQTNSFGSPCRFRFFLPKKPERLYHKSVKKKNAVALYTGNMVK